MKWFLLIVFVISMSGVVVSIVGMLSEAKRSANARFEQRRQEIARQVEEQINKESQCEPGFLE